MRLPGWMTGLWLIMGVAQAVAGNPLQISGQSMQPQTATLVLPGANRQGQLQFSLEQPVTVTGWPSSLPARLGKQTVTLRMITNPGGPITLLSFARPGETSPWLTLIQNGQNGSLLPGPRQLRLRADRALLVDQDESTRVVIPGQPVIWRDNAGMRWRFELLNIQPVGAGPDNPPRASWYLRKL